MRLVLFHGVKDFEFRISDLLQVSTSATEYSEARTE